jgi:hypothetical protein
MVFLLCATFLFPAAAAPMETPQFGIIHSPAVLIVH